MKLVHGHMRAQRAAWLAGFWRCWVYIYIHVDSKYRASTRSEITHARWMFERLAGYMERERESGNR